LPEVPAVRATASKVAALLAACALALTLAGCTASAPSSAEQGGRLRVVAAESCWGSIAEQLGGDKVHVTALISNPNADPHDYEPTVTDARAMANANYVVYNGIGYDPWAQRLLGANPVRGRAVLDVGNVAGVAAGGNPHQWYSPSVVHAVVRTIAADYTKLDPTDAAYFERRRQKFETQSLANYDALVSQIASMYAGTPIGASESLVAPLAAAMHLKLITPPGLLTAVSEGVDPSAADKALTDRQIKAKQIAVFVYNRQNSTPDVMTLVAEAKAAGIEVVTVTETPEPAGSQFQDWQVAQLRQLKDALSKATGR
jgi:zinc/manganese transport system substrate-binding protein